MTYLHYSVTSIITLLLEVYSTYQSISRIPQNRDAAAKRKVQEEYTVKQKDEQDAFAELNVVISKNLSKIMSTIEELDIAGY